MLTVILNEFGSHEQLICETCEDMDAGAGQILVDVEAAGVNYLDLTQRSGASQVHKIELPTVLGLEGVGRVCALGEGVDVSATGLSVGSRVAWVDVRGSYTSLAVIPAGRAVAVPDDFSVSECLLFQALTAQYLVHEYRTILPGDRVLVHAAAGGLGQLLVQWLKHLGAWVVGTTSSGNKAEAIRAAGADSVVVYGDNYEFVDEVNRLTDRKGIDLAFDGLGEKTLLKTIATLGHGGTVVAIGAASGPIPFINPTQLTQRGLRLAGGSVFSYIADPAELRKRSAEVIAAIQAGWLRLDEATPYPLDCAADAHRDIESRQSKGKLYLTPTLK